MKLETTIAVNRFGLGPTVADLSAARADPKAWLGSQIKTPLLHPALERLPASSSGLKEFLKYVAKLGLNRPARTDDTAMNESMGMDAPPTEPTRSVESAFREHFGPLLQREFAGRLAAAVESTVPFHERLVWFWSNHFTVSLSKPAIAGVVGAFEREAIRPHVTGKFVDLLLAAALHPTMIIYLDNNLSIAPGSAQPANPLAARANFPRATGLNENLAREILELHTLGAGSGYTQTDVTTFARALTGWTVGGLINTGTRFVASRHDESAKTILGKLYSQSGQKQAETVLRDLAAHPSTASHVATKLARHFIADRPPEAAISRLAKVFRDTDGDLAKVYAALIDSPEVWAQPLAKVKQPNELVVSTLRTLGTRGRSAAYENATRALASMGQTPFAAPSPKGWPDNGEAWLGADGVWKRIEWANAVALRVGNSVDVLALADNSYGVALSAVTRRALERAESREQALALWLASPEFQRR
jgi:uncharacterized protein (DUF1800 family)